MKRTLVGAFGAVILVTVLTLAAGASLDQASTFGIGGRALGIGGAFTALADGPFGPYWNPAGPARLDVGCVGGMSARLGDLGATCLSLGALVPIGTFGLAVGWDSVSVPCLVADDWDLSFGDASNRHLSCLRGTLAVHLLADTYLGVNVKRYVAADCFGFSSAGLGFDVGLILGLAGDTALGVAGIDLGGTEISWEEGVADIVLGSYKVGFATWLLDGSLLLASDVDLSSSLEVKSVHLGVEIGVTDHIALRGGTVLSGTLEKTSLRLGAGIEAGGLSVNGVWIMDTVSGHSFALSAELCFGICPPEVSLAAASIVWNAGEAWIYDQETHTWMRIDPAGDIAGVENSGEKVVVWNAGEAWVYDQKTHTWMRVDPAGDIDNVLVVGHKAVVWNAGEACIYDQETHTWMRIDPAGDIVGIENSGEKVVVWNAGEAWVYDQKTHTWMRVDPAGDIDNVLVVGHKAVVWNAGEACIYDQETHTWMRIDPAGDIVGIENSGEKVVVWNAGEAWVYDQKTHTWMRVDPAGDIDNVLVVGHKAVVWNAGEAWIYDQETHTWMRIDPAGDIAGVENSGEKVVVWNAGEAWVYDQKTHIWMRVDPAGDIDNVLVVGHKAVVWNAGEAWIYDQETHTWMRIDPAGDIAGVENSGEKVVVWNAGEAWVYDQKTHIWMRVDPAGDIDNVLVVGHKAVVWNAGEAWIYDQETHTWMRIDPAGDIAGVENSGEKVVVWNAGEAWVYDQKIHTWMRIDPAGDIAGVENSGEKVVVWNAGEAWVYDQKIHTWMRIDPAGDIDNILVVGHKAVVWNAGEACIYDQETHTWMRIDPAGDIAGVENSGEKVVVWNAGEAWVYDQKIHTWMRIDPAGDIDNILVVGHKAVVWNAGEACIYDQKTHTWMRVDPAGDIEVVTLAQVQFHGVPVEPMGEARLDVLAERGVLRVSNLRGDTEGSDGIRILLPERESLAFDLEFRIPVPEGDLPPGRAIEIRFTSEAGEVLFRHRLQTIEVPDRGMGWLVSLTSYARSFVVEVSDGDGTLSGEVFAQPQGEDELTPIGVYGFSEKGYITLKDVHYDDGKLCVTIVACPPGSKEIDCPTAWVCMFPASSICDGHICGPHSWCQGFDNPVLRMCPLEELDSQVEVYSVEMVTLNTTPDLGNEVPIDTIEILSIDVH